MRPVPVMITSNSTVDRPIQYPAVFRHRKDVVKNAWIIVAPAGMLYSHFHQLEYADVRCYTILVVLG
jgi:hypothetical protein